MLAGNVPLAGCIKLVGPGILRVASLDKIEGATYGQLSAHLGPGESGTIAAAGHRQEVGVTDDLAARRACADMAIQMTGIIGIVRATVRDRQLALTDANDLLRTMVESGLHSPMQRLPV